VDYSNLSIAAAGVENLFSGEIAEYEKPVLSVKSRPEFWARVALQSKRDPAATRHRDWGCPQYPCLAHIDIHFSSLLRI